MLNAAADLFHSLIVGPLFVTACMAILLAPTMAVLWYFSLAPFG